MVFPDKSAGISSTVQGWNGVEIEAEGKASKSYNFTLRIHTELPVMNILHIMVFNEGAFKGVRKSRKVHKDANVCAFSRLTYSAYTHSCSGHIPFSMSSKFCAIDLRAEANAFEVARITNQLVYLRYAGFFEVAGTSAVFSGLRHARMRLCFRDANTGAASSPIPAVAPVARIVFRDRSAGVFHQQSKVMS